MKFRIISKKGDEAYDYDIETAEMKFSELLLSGMIPVAVGGEGEHRVLNKFNPDIDEMMWMPRIAGG